MIENTPIYAITCLEKIETDANNTGFPDFGATAFMGFYYSEPPRKPTVLTVG